MCFGQKHPKHTENPLKNISDDTRPFGIDGSYNALQFKAILHIEICIINIVLKIGLHLLLINETTLQGVKNDISNKHNLLKSTYDSIMEISLQ